MIIIFSFPSVLWFPIFLIHPIISIGLPILALEFSLLIFCVSLGERLSER